MQLLACGLAITAIRILWGENGMLLAFQPLKRRVLSAGTLEWSSQNHHDTAYVASRVLTNAGEAVAEGWTRCDRSGAFKMLAVSVVDFRQLHPLPSGRMAC